MNDFLHHEITQQIIGASFEVHRELGYGFLEKVYRRSLSLELHNRGLEVVEEARLLVHYKGKEVGEYYADLLVQGVVVVELKVAKTYQVADEAQLLNELKASGHRVGLLINFGQQKVEFKRLVY